MRAAPRTPRDFHWKAPSDRTEPPRRMPASDSEPTTWVFTKRLGLGRVAQPNESRLSCGALKKDSFIIYARRQLQALVRLRTTRHSSGPSLSLSRRSTHRPCPDS